MCAVHGQQIQVLVILMHLHLLVRFSILLCLSTFQFVTSLHSQDQARQSKSYGDSSNLADTNMVLHSDDNTCSGTQNTSQEEKPSTSTSKQGTSTTEKTSSYGMQGVRSAYRKKNSYQSYHVVLAQFNKTRI